MSELLLSHRSVCRYRAHPAPAGSAVVLGGGITLLVAVVAATRAPQLRELGALDQWTAKS